MVQDLNATDTVLCTSTVQYVRCRISTVIFVTTRVLVCLAEAYEYCNVGEKSTCSVLGNKH